MPSGLPQTILLPTIGELVLDEDEHDYGDGTRYIDSAYEAVTRQDVGSHREVSIRVWVSKDEPFELAGFIERTEARWKAIRNRTDDILRESVSGWEDDLANSALHDASPEEVARVARLIVANAIPMKVLISSASHLTPGEESHRIDISLRHPLVGYGEAEWMLDDHDLHIGVSTEYRACRVGMDG